jgi:poly-gamma-glutamate synthesis protein (capsule biosynthesis protein)
LSQELETSVRDGFTLGAVGNCIISCPLSQYADRDDQFASTLKILGQSTVLYGNLESSILDIREFNGFPYSWDGDWALVSEPAVARDLVKMGLHVVSRANNHALDWGIEGMRETSRWLDAAGLVHAGAGENRGLAVAPRYFESAKGRIGIVSMVSTYRATTAALPTAGAAPGRPGVNALGVKRTTIFPSEVMTALARVDGMFNPKPPSEKTEPHSDRKAPVPGTPPTKLTLFENEFELGDSPAYRYKIDPVDLAEVLRSIRQGKEHSDFLIAAIHSHECWPCTFPESPAKFLSELARAALMRAPTPSSRPAFTI